MIFNINLMILMNHSAIELARIKLAIYKIYYIKYSQHGAEVARLMISPPSGA